MRQLLVLLGLVIVGILAMGSSMGTMETDGSVDLGPDVVILDDLEDIYAPVPFEHRLHAEMAQMWNGCVTCHHRPPHPGDAATTATLTMPTGTPHSQDEAASIPACKSCHPVDAAETIRMPNLKGAYHRQCLNCHKEWMHENACVVCHEPKGQEQLAKQEAPSPGDIVGRMHPPIPEPDVVHYEMRYTPAAGGNVMFRHREHTVDFGISCASCHVKDNCSHCHGPTGDTTALKPLKPGMTWEESHGPCIACHQEERCDHCHYKDDQPPPGPFNHVQTGQGLDETHAKLACGECHSNWRTLRIPTTCGDSTCHKDETIKFPFKLPGPLHEPGRDLPAAADNAAGEVAP